MPDDTTIVAIEAALRNPDGCACNRGVDIVPRDGALWLECRSFGEPSRLPSRLAFALRGVTHLRSFVAELPAEPASASAADPAPRMAAPTSGSRRIAAGA